jgi:hypothetical protein
MAQYGESPHRQNMQPQSGIYNRRVRDEPDESLNLTTRRPSRCNIIMGTLTGNNLERQIR